MSAYVIVGVDVTGPNEYADYSREVPATLEPYGGRFVVRGGAFDSDRGRMDVAPDRGPPLPERRAGEGMARVGGVPGDLPIRERNARTAFMVVVEGVD